MPDATPNTGSNVTISIYVDDKKLGRDYSDVHNWDWSREYYENTVETLGDTPVIPVQKVKAGKGTFAIYESDASFCGQVEQAIADSEDSSQRPKIVIVERTTNGSGTIGKVTFPDVALKAEGHAMASKGDIRMRTYSFRSSKPREE